MSNIIRTVAPPRPKILSLSYDLLLSNQVSLDVAGLSILLILENKNIISI